MTSPHQPPVRQSATEIDLCAADWLQRQSFWTWSAEDQADFDTWLAQSRAHRIAYWRQKSVWESAQRLKALRAPMARPGWSIPATKTKPFVLRIAAAAIFAALVGTIGYRDLGSVSKPENVYATPVGGRETIALSDGSRIELNTNTRLRVHTDKHTRMVMLERGEAYFDIRHDAARPFVVDVAGHRITDLGTKFTVRDGADRLEVTLLQGKARLDSTDRSNPPNSAVLSPGEVAIATPQSVTVIRKPKKILDSQMGWRRGVLTFYHATLADAAREFNRYNQRKIVVVDDAAESELIDGTFPVNDVDLFGRVAHSVLGARIENKGHDIVISR